MPVEIDKLSRFDIKSDVKVLAVGPSKQEVIVGGHNGRSKNNSFIVLNHLLIVLRMLKIEPDLSIKQVVRNFGTIK